MPAAKLTDRLLRGLSVDADRAEYWDEVVRNLHLRVSASGSKVFYVRYRAGGRQRRFKIGRFPELSLAKARSRAREILGKVESDEDPQQERQQERKAETFRELARAYIEDHAKPLKRSWAEDQRKLDRDILPAWGFRRVKEITRQDVRRLARKIKDRGSPVAANRTLALISKIFNYAIDEEIVEANPAARVGLLVKERSRTRVLSEEEIRRLWTALDTVHPVVAASYRLRLLTAQRGIEVLTIRHEDIDGAWWTIPAERSKNGESHRVFLSQQSREVIDALSIFDDGSGWLLPSPKKSGHRLANVRKATLRLRAASDVDFTPHDLRRTAASLMTGAGINRLVVAKILNHVERGATKIYDRHSYDPEKRQALALWGDRLDSILRGERAGGKVLRIG